ncbi:restriction endonuclease subunit S, partial [Staphylococcus equorum]
LYALYKLIRKESTKLQGTSIKGLTKNDLLSKHIKIPSYINEQEQIGDFFSKLDRQIELEEQKLEKLEEQKKGYMQKIFSQQLGFKDENGNEYPTWQSYKLGNLYKKGKAGGTPKSTESKYYNGEVPFLSISDITEQGKFIMNTEKSITQEGVDNSTAWLVPVNSINYAMYASVGYLSINKIEVATSQAIFNMVFEDNNLVEYIYYYLNHIRDKGILEKLVGTGTQSNLSASIMKSMYIKLPDYEEMVKITDFLSKVDKLIEKQNQKIDGLKERKKGFLQKMFV